MADLKPWDCHPDLTEVRLQTLARFFANTRREVIDEYSPEKGDDSWSLGCRSNSWWRNRLIQIAASGDWEWLRIVSPTKGFVFTIGSVPVRFYRGRSSRPPASTLSNRHDELRQLELAFGRSEYRDLKWRFAIETGLTGEPTSIMFVGHADDGSINCFWVIPFDADVTEFMPDSYEAPQSVEIPPPMIAPEQSDTSVAR